VKWKRAGTSFHPDCPLKLNEMVNDPAAVDITGVTSVVYQYHVPRLEHLHGPIRSPGGVGEGKHPIPFGLEFGPNLLRGKSVEVFT
jgi:hypothetical protein